ncbi:MAG: AAA family ATPase, partial [Bacteroidota bacterium]
MKKLPIGIQNIQEIIEEGYVYIDKTSFAHHLITTGKHYFLSRPRRFGKSLFLDTLAEIFKGNKDLFKTYAIYQTDYDWKPYPVLSLSFSRIPCRTDEKLEQGLQRALKRIAKQHALAVDIHSAQEGLDALVSELVDKYDRQVVILIDEYDKPITANLKHLEVANANRELLRDFFGTLKDLDHAIKFTFITGISRFSKVSLFSEANHLKDVTMHPDYAAIAGYTEDELSQAFEEHIQAITRGRGVPENEILAEIKAWYNGYRFSRAATCVYNPFSTLNYMDEKEPKGYWFASGTPKFLIHELQKQPQVATEFSGINIPETQLSDSRSPEDLDLPALMFQTGYLTIKDWAWDATLEETVFSLDFPNKEVYKAFFQSLLREFGKVAPQEISSMALQLRAAMEALDMSAVVQTLNIQLAKIPYDAFQHAKEGFYQAMLLLCFEISGLKTFGEVHTNLGRIDLVVQLPKHTFIFELKVDKKVAVALDQLHNKRYQECYLKDGKEIVAAALCLSTKDHNISAWQA